MRHRAYGSRTGATPRSKTWPVASYSCRTFKYLFWEANMSNPIPLDLFEPNPWQTRQGVDEGYIAELVDDIRRNGLLQDPLGRLVKGGEPLPIVEASRVSLEGQAMKRGGITVQLAFGHNRLAAYQRL